MCGDTHIRFKGMPEGESLTTSESIAFDLHDIRMLLATMVLIMETKRQENDEDTEAFDALDDGTRVASDIVFESARL